MGMEVDKKFTWVIKDFCSVQPKKIYSDEFVVDGCKWRLMAFPKGNNVECLSLYLDVAGSESLPCGWKRNALVHFTIVNQVFEELSLIKATQHWFDAGACDWGFTSIFPLDKLYDKDGGFLVNGEVKIVANVDVHEVIGKQDVPDEYEEATKSLSNLEEDDGVESCDFLEEASSVKESMDVNGFQVLPSQVESVSRIFERHPDIASKFRSKNQHLRSAYMSVLLSLIETLYQSTQELSNDDRAEAHAALAYLTTRG